MTVNPIRTIGAASFHPVPAHEVGAAWRVAEPWIVDAIARQALRDTAETFRDLCADGRAQLWLVIDGITSIGKFFGRLRSNVTDPPAKAGGFSITR